MAWQLQAAKQQFSAAATIDHGHDTAARQPPSPGGRPPTVLSPTPAQSERRRPSLDQPAPVLPVLPGPVLPALPEPV
jgi:hypothetical protein